MNTNDDTLLQLNPNYQTARDWAFRNMTDADLAEYNSLVSEPATKAAGIDLLFNRWIEARAAEAPPTPAAAPELKDPELYYSQSDMTAAMRDPRYQTDPRFREEVAYRVYQSKNAGILENTGRFYSQGGETTARLGDRLQGWHEGQKRDLEAQQAAEHAARLERQAQQARQEADQSQQQQMRTHWS